MAALLPAATEIVIALGAGEALVATTHACRLPPALAAVPRVTRSRVTASGASSIDARVSELSQAGTPLCELDEALLAAQRPEVLLTQGVCDVCAVPAEDVRAVAARLRPPPAVVTLGAGTVDGILEDILSVANTIGVPGEGEELVAGLRSRIARVHETLKANRAPRPRVVMLEWTDPLFSAGHWVPDMIRRGGGHELIGRTGEPSRRVGAEEVRAANPDVIVLTPCGVSLVDAEREGRSLLEREEWSWARSVPVWAIDANRLASSPGPGVVDGIEVLARVLHPSLFGKPSLGDALQISR